MKTQTLVILTLILTALMACQNDRKPSEAKDLSEPEPNKESSEVSNPSEIENDREFSAVKNLAEFKQTQFTPTLEHQISNNKNAVYCATLLFAWDAIRMQMHTPITVSDEYFDLKLLNSSTTFTNVLKNNEYKISGDIDGDTIKAKAEFNKSLPFEVNLQSFDNKLTFGGQKVASFGIQGNDDYELLKTVKIIYYQNDNNFIIKLLPKDAAHEIILFKPDKNFNSIAEMTAEVEKLTEIGKSEINNEKLNWKYYYNAEDEVIIPKLNFNIQTNYSTLEGSVFNADNQYFVVAKAWQRTAFILDENGAEIESEAEIEVEEEESEEEYEKPKPKKMIFDKPFLILLKRTDAKNPYFGLWSSNTELMIQE